ncbi:MAG: hypothetical protein K2P57_11405 [Burkholderiales bacterium]|nr:hypothetical protein [Burkholderiales bacterium]
MGNVMIHVRFATDGSVNEIGERPSGASAQTWFNHLSRNTLNCYEALSGGRGIFRIARDQVDALKASCTQ